MLEEPLSLSSNARKQQKKKTYHCLDVWAIPKEVYQLSAAEREEHILTTLIRSSNDGPFPPNSLHQHAPISFWEEIVTPLMLLIPMGGPLVWILATMTALLYDGGDNSTAATTRRLLAILISVFLAYHPMPTSYCSKTGKKNTTFLQQSVVTHLLYRYFTYRFVWVDDNYQYAKANTPWIGAGPPHGVLPFANILSVPAINTFFCLDFVGAPASIVFHTPFLRYFTFFPSTPVSRHAVAATIQQGSCVGLVPDGIAGIFHQSAHKEVVALKTRTSLARHALQHGTNLLPAYSFGNTQTFDAWWDPWGWMQSISRKAQASLFLYWG